MTARKQRSEEWPRPPKPAPRFDEDAVAQAIAEASPDVVTHIRNDVSRVWNGKAAPVPAAVPPVPVDAPSAGEALMNIVAQAHPIDVTFDWVVKDDVATIHYLRVPEGHRRTGLATKTYKGWEATLAPEVKRIEVESLPQVAALEFWHSLGFRATDKDGWSMVKDR